MNINNIMQTSFKIKSKKKQQETLLDKPSWDDYWSIQMLLDFQIFLCNEVTLELSQISMLGFKFKIYP